MKKWWIIPILFVLLTIVVDAKCGDSFCDPNEDCTNCVDDCLCTLDKHDDRVNCTTLFTSIECEKGYCDDRWCSTLEGFQSIFQKATCSDNGSVSLEIKFQELDSVVLTPVEDLKVYIKLGEEATFEEIKGVWYNPSREGDFRYTKIRDTSNFFSDTDLFKLKGDYYVRVKYQIGRSNIIFEDELVSCPGMPQLAMPAEKPCTQEAKLCPDGTTVGRTGPDCEFAPCPTEKPAEKPVEKPKKCGNENEFCGGIAGIMCCEGLTCQYDGDYPDAGGKCVKGTAKTVEEPKIEKPESKTSLVWYIIIGIIILGAIIFFVRYELKIIRRIQ